MDIDEDLVSDNLATSPSANQTSESPIDQSEIDALLVEHPYASEPTYFTRPNRYHGPPSTWRSWTADDRAVAESLDIARAGDLSVHLYNAFDLKMRSQAEQVARLARNGGQIDGKARSDDDEEGASRQFTPPDVWTAWPLRRKHVLRDSQLQAAARLSRFGPEMYMPSTPLAEALLATTLRHAKEKWEARSKKAKPQQQTTRNHDWKDEREFTEKKIKSQEADEEARGIAADRESVDSGSTAESEAVSNVSNAAALNENLPPGTQLFSSQAFAALDSSSSEDEPSTTGSEEDEPVFSADDDRARQLLQPAIRHILTQFDDLLGGLHEARVAYALKGDDSRSRSRSRLSVTQTTTDDEQFIQSGSRAASVKRGRKRKRALSESRHTGKEQSSRSRGRSATKKSEKRRQQYALRDWSDVMGMALLKGWNTQTVARASERCARLFGQNMAFRTFHQGIDRKITAQPEEPWFEETLAYVPLQNEDHAQDEPHPLTYNIPSTESQKIECIRTSSSCSRCRSIRSRCQPLNPVSTDELGKKVSCSACLSLTTLGAQCSGILIQPRPTSAARTCPYQDCPRHAPAKSFAKMYHLQRHLTDVHGDIYSPLTSPAPSTPVTNDHVHNESATPEHIRSATHLSCPVSSCPQSARVYTRSTRLYDHIRRKHPEFDVDALKQIVARSGERGKYDRSRSRSRQATAAQHEDIDENDTDDGDNLEEHDERAGIDAGLDNAMQ